MNIYDSLNELTQAKVYIFPKTTNTTISIHDTTTKDNRTQLFRHFIEPFDFVHRTYTKVPISGCGPCMAPGLRSRDADRPTLITHIYLRVTTYFSEEMGRICPNTM